MKKRFLLIPIVSAIPSLTLFSLFTQLEKIGSEWWKIVLVAIVTGLCTYLCFRKLPSKRQIVFSILGGYLYAFCYVLGATTHDLLKSARTFHGALVLLAKGLGYSVFAISVLLVILVYLPSIRSWFERSVEKEKSKTRNRKAGWIYAFYVLVIFACYIPTFLAYYPVIFEFDGVYQIRDVISGVHSVWHPLAHTLLLGLFYNFGRAIGSAAIGMSLYSLFQMFVMALVFGYTVYILYKHHAPKWIRIVLLLIYALFPVNAIFAITTTKDILFAAFFLAFLVIMIDGIMNHIQYSVLSIIMMIVTGGLMLLYRNNAIYALIVAAPFILWNMKGARIRITCVLVGSMVLYLVVNNILIAAVHAPERNDVKEKLSLPLMQLTYVTAEDKGSLSEETLNEIYSYIPENCMQGYYMIIADQIKSGSNNTLLRNNMKNFIKLWGKTGLTHPAEYLDAATLLTMGYWYMDDIYLATVYKTYMLLGHKEIGSGEEIEKTCLFPLWKKVTESLFGANQYQKIPIVSTLCKAPFYFWLLIGYMLIMWCEKKYRYIAPAFLCLTYYATLFLGPVALVRYMYFMMPVAPVFVYLLLYSPMKSEKVEVTEE